MSPFWTGVLVGGIGGLVLGAVGALLWFAIWFAIKYRKNARH